MSQKFRIFTMRGGVDGEYDTTEINDFCEHHKILEVQTQFYMLQEEAIWSTCVRYKSNNKNVKHREQQKHLVPEDKKEKKKNPYYNLDQLQRQRYDAIRKWRNEHAKLIGKPPYSITTNDIIAEIAKKMPQSKQKLKTINGIGQGFVDSYANMLLPFIASILKTEKTLDDICKEGNTVITETNDITTTQAQPKNTEQYKGNEPKEHVKSPQERNNQEKNKADTSPGGKHVEE